MPHDFLIGLKLGNVKILRLIGKGGMAMVFEGVQTSLNRKVAVKVLPPSATQSPEDVERFVREAEAAARLSHPNIVQIFEISEAEGIHYFTMELIVGRTLRQKLREEGAMPPTRVVKVLEQVADALRVSHEAGIIHRDIKTSNIMIDKQGHVKVTDFGIARTVGEESLTETGHAIGSVDYMSPEQCNGKDLDPRTDLYSLGIVGYEMLSGETPFKADTFVAMALKHVKEPPPRLVSPKWHIQDELRSVVDRLMKKDRRKRYKSSKDLLNALKGIDSQIVDRTIEEVQAEKEATRKALVDKLRKYSESAVTGSKKRLPVMAGKLGDAISRLQRMRPGGLRDTAKRYQGGVASARHTLKVVVLRTIMGVSIVFLAIAIGIFIMARRSEPEPTAEDKPIFTPPTFSAQMIKETLLAQAKDALIARDFDHASAIAERILRDDPGDVKAKEILDLIGAIKKEMLKPRGPSLTLPPGCSAQVGSSIESFLGSKLPREIIHNKTAIEFVLVPSGEFLMGSPASEKGRWPEEGPQHRVAIDRPFYLGKYEVTNAQYDSFLQAKGRETRIKISSMEQRPAASLSWHDAVAFADWAGLRLPTEAEWEYACRAGSTSPLCYGSGEEELGNYAWYDKNSGRESSLVGKKSPNSWGFYDMHGNVWEWCQDEFQKDYRNAPSDGSAFMQSDVSGNRAIRGGSAQLPSSECRSACRRGLPPDSQGSDIGLRLAIDAPVSPVTTPSSHTHSITHSP